MDQLKQAVHKFEAKAGDHPNVSSDSSMNPKSGIEDVNSGNDPGKSETQNWIEAGQGAGQEGETHRAGSTTSKDTVPAGVAGKAI